MWNRLWNQLHLFLSHWNGISGIKEHKGTRLASSDSTCWFISLRPTWNHSLQWAKLNHFEKTNAAQILMLPRQCQVEAGHKYRAPLLQDSVSLNFIRARSLVHKLNHTNTFKEGISEIELEISFFFNLLKLNLTRTEQNAGIKTWKENTRGNSVSAERKTSKSEKFHKRKTMTWI